MSSLATVEEIEEDQKEKQPETKLINSAIHARSDRKLVLSGLNIEKLLAQYKEQELEQPLYIIPLHISDDGRIDDVAGQPSTAGQAVIDVFVVFTEDRIAEQFPSLVRFSKWKTMFKDGIADKTELAEKAGLKKHVPLFLPDLPYYAAQIVAELCATDTLINNFGPFGKTAATKSIPN